MIKAIIFLLGFFLIGCTPYKCFYKETYSSDEDILNKKVYRFVLDGNKQLENIEFESLTKLTSLKLVNVSSEQLNKALEQLPNPQKLNVLMLDSLKLTSLPTSLVKFTNLKHISLNYNPEFNFNEGFKTLEGLPIEFLNLQHNELNKLPASITLLKSLQDLNLSHNSISESKTYELLGQLPKLHSLWLTNNHIKFLPESIGGLLELKNLYVEHNQLKELPAKIVNMKKVWVVHAGHNLFEELPERLALMPSLILLHINNCPIKSIPEVYATKKSSVLGLIMDNNKLTALNKLKWGKTMNHFFVLSLE